MVTLKFRIDQTVTPTHFFLYTNLENLGAPGWPKLSSETCHIAATLHGLDGKEVHGMEGPRAAMVLRPSFLFDGHF
jgi:hypothetical protein